MKITESANDELSVKPFDNQHKRSSILHPDLLHPPFSLLLVGPKGSGKGNCTLRLIFGNQKKKGCQTDHHKFYRHYFDKIYVFSSTWQLDPKMRRCQIPTDQIFEEPEMYTEVISEILEGQVEDIEEEGKEEADDILMIFSDLAGHKTFADSKGIMNRLAFNHRHYNVSIIIDTQSLRQINNAFRNNLSGIILFAGINNRLELKKIYEEYLGSFTQKEATALLNYTFDSPFNFLYINYQQAKGKRFHKNFNRLRIEGAAMT